jgi:hypothetical protein
VAESGRDRSGDAVRAAVRQHDDGNHATRPRSTGERAVVHQSPQPRKVVSRRKMGILLHCFHITMCLCTLGLWIPVYLSGLRKRKTVTRYR